MVPRLSFLNEGPGRVQTQPSVPGYLTSILPPCRPARGQPLLKTERPWAGLGLLPAW